jgi:hypothetical protein
MDDVGLVWMDWSSRSDDASWVLSQLPLCCPVKREKLKKRNLHRVFTLPYSPLPSSALQLRLIFVVECTDDQPQLFRI